MYEPGWQTKIKVTRSERKMEQDSLIQRNLQLDQNISIIAIMIKYLLLLTDVKPLGKISENGW